MKVESSETTEETGAKAAAATEQTDTAATARAEAEATTAEGAGKPKPSASTPPEEKKTEGGKSKKGLLLIPLFLLLAGLGVVLGIRIGSGLGDRSRRRFDQTKRPVCETGHTGERQGGRDGKRRERRKK